MIYYTNYDIDKNNILIQLLVIKLNKLIRYIYI